MKAWMLSGLRADGRRAGLGVGWDRWSGAATSRRPRRSPAIAHAAARWRRRWGISVLGLAGVPRRAARVHGPTRHHLSRPSLRKRRYLGWGGFAWFSLPRISRTSSSLTTFSIRTCTSLVREIPSFFAACWRYSVSSKGIVVYLMVK